MPAKRSTLLAWAALVSLPLLTACISRLGPHAGSRMDAGDSDVGMTGSESDAGGRDDGGDSADAGGAVDSGTPPIVAHVSNESGWASPRGDELWLVFVAPLDGTLTAVSVDGPCRVTRSVRRTVVADEGTVVWLDHVAGCVAGTYSVVLSFGPAVVASYSMTTGPLWNGEPKLSQVTVARNDLQLTFSGNAADSYYLDTVRFYAGGELAAACSGPTGLQTAGATSFTLDCALGAGAYDVLFLGEYADQKQWFQRATLTIVDAATDGGTTDAGTPPTTIQLTNQSGWASMRGDELWLVFVPYIDGTLTAVSVDGPCHATQNVNLAVNTSQPAVIGLEHLAGCVAGTYTVVMNFGPATIAIYSVTTNWLWTGEPKLSQMTVKRSGSRLSFAGYAADPYYLDSIRLYAGGELVAACPAATGLEPAGSTSFALDCAVIPGTYEISFLGEYLNHEQWFQQLTLSVDDAPGDGGMTDAGLPPATPTTIQLTNQSGWASTRGDELWLVFVPYVEGTLTAVSLSGPCATVQTQSLKLVAGQASVVGMENLPGCVAGTYDVALTFGASYVARYTIATGPLWTGYPGLSAMTITRTGSRLTFAGHSVGNLQLFNLRFYAGGELVTACPVVTGLMPGGAVSFGGDCAAPPGTYEISFIGANGTADFQWFQRLTLVVP